MFSSSTKTRLKTTERKKPKLCFTICLCNTIHHIYLEFVQAHEVAHRSFINKCYGTHHKAFLLDTSPFRSVQRTFWNPEDYESKGFWNFALAITRRVFKICTTCVSLLATSNLTEAFLYYKIISYMNRYYQNRICVSIC